MRVAVLPQPGIRHMTLQLWWAVTTWTWEKRDGSRSGSSETPGLVAIAVGLGMMNDMFG